MSRTAKGPAATVVVGIGNELMSDEGAGLMVLAKLQETRYLYPDVDFVDAGSISPRIIHILNGRSKAIFVDCAIMGEKPGTVRRFTPAEVVSVKNKAFESIHSGDLLQTLEVARQIGSYPDSVVIFGIQPENVSPGNTLSPAIAASIDACAKAIQCELEIQ